MATTNRAKKSGKAATAKSGSGVRRQRYELGLYRCEDDDPGCSERISGVAVALSPDEVETLMGDFRAIIQERHSRGILSLEL